MLEDTTEASLAGHFQSLLNIQGKEALFEAIQQVIASYCSDAMENDVFIQPMITNVGIAGVLFTLDPSTGAPYYVSNFNDAGNTHSVTQGEANEDRLIYWHKSVDISLLQLWQQQLFALARELESLFATTALDIEFAFNERNELYLLQVRPLIVNHEIIALESHHHTVARIASYIERIISPHPYLNGQRSVLGVMPDWNPAEIIGVRPKPLALSLYRELVTDSIWAYQRNNYGYKQVRSFPLLVSLSGLPYIDVRVSFNSFIPAGTSEQLAEKLVNYYIEQLVSNPEKHDKIEFDIIFSCYTLDCDDRLEKLRQWGFTQEELCELKLALRDLTNKIVSTEGLWYQDSKKIAKLPERRQAIMQSQLSVIEKIYWLLEDCKRYGTLPFAGLARAGFIAVQFLQSLVNIGILSQADYSRFHASLDTVSSQMKRDRCELSTAGFLEKYGHLRPGTYDILSPRYDEAFDTYFDASTTSEAQTKLSRFELSAAQLEALNELLKIHEIEHDVVSLFHFIKHAIEGREYAKFIFTKSLSDTMQLIGELGQSYGYSIEDMSYLNINDLQSLYATSNDIAGTMQESIARGKLAFAETKHLILPPLIVKGEDAFLFELPPGEPNFITLESVTADVTSDLRDGASIHNKIVFIPSADPGYDWLFAYPIKGLVTKYGGANSHMAIRAGEQAIPAIIGAGEIYFDKWIKAETINIDAANKKVTIIK